MSKLSIGIDITIISLVVFSALIYLFTDASPSTIAYCMIAGIAVMSEMENIIHEVMYDR